MSWPELLKYMICRLYRAWGGNCDDLGSSEPDWVLALCAEYAANGLPVFPDLTARAQFASDVDDLEAHLALPGNTLSSDDHLDLTAFIAEAENDLQGA